MRRLILFLVLLLSPAGVGILPAPAPHVAVQQRLHQPAALTVTWAWQGPQGASATLLAFGGGEAGAAGADGVASGTTSFQTGTVHSGTYAYEANPTTTNTGILQITYTASATTWGTFYFRYATKAASGDEPICAVRQSNNTVKLTIRLNSSGDLVAYDSAGTLLATGTTALSSGAWYRLGVECGSSATVGAWEVRINGVSEISGTANTTATSGAQFLLGRTAGISSQSVDYFYDDWAVSDSDYPGVQQTAVLAPNATGTFQTATIGAGSTHNGATSEIPTDSDTSYLVTDGTTGDAETENLASSASASISGTINGARADAFCKRDGANNGFILVRVRSGTTNSDSGSKLVASLYGWQNNYYLTDPSTSAAWTTGGLDSAEAGVVENGPGGANGTVDTTKKSRVSTIYLMVNFTAAAGGTTFSTGTLTGVGLLPPGIGRHPARLTWN